MKIDISIVLILFCVSFGLGQKKSTRNQVHKRKAVLVVKKLKAKRPKFAPPLQAEPSSEVFLNTVTALPDMPAPYIALEGDTLAKIAARLKMSVEFLAEINRLLPDTPLAAGQKITVSLR